MAIVKRQPLIVQKFGGTSVGTIERIRHVARHALETQKTGQQVVLVVSAMSGETNRLVDLANQINPIPYSKEYDLLVAAGEQVSVGLVSLAINTLAGETKSHPFLAYQVGLRTDAVYSKARIMGVQTDLLRAKLKAGLIPVIAGFQGVDAEGNLTTLGRGGSDTSAVAIAAALKADDCEIYTDVDGVYTTDPRLCARARKISVISHEEMMELATLGAKVLHPRSVELAAKWNVPVHVRSSFENVEGTRVVKRPVKKSAKSRGKKTPGSAGPAMGLEDVVVVGVAAQAKQVRVNLQNVKDRPGVAAEIFGALSDAAIVVDVIVQDASAEGKLTISFTIEDSDRLKALKILESLKSTHRDYAGMSVHADGNLAKVSIVGAGMQNNPGVAARMFRLLAKARISIQLITTSEIKVSCLVAGDHMKNAVEVLHDGFELDKIN